MTWAHVFPGGVIHDMKVTDLDHRPSWTRGKPIGAVNHFTVTCNVLWPGSGRFESEGIGSAFGIRRDATVCQYTDLDRSTWHARDCSHYTVGIEYDANPGAGCPITEEQLEAGAQLNAWLCKTFGIPAARSPGIAYNPGIKAHTDGLEDGGTKWNEARHWDAVWKPGGDAIDRWISTDQRRFLNLSPWSADQFIQRVKDILDPPPPPPSGGFMADLTTEQQLDIYNRLHFYIRGLAMGLGLNPDEKGVNQQVGIAFGQFLKDQGYPK